MLASLVQGLVALAGLMLAWLLQVHPLGNTDCSVQAIFWGIAGTIPMLSLFALSWNSSWASLKEIRQFLIEHLGPLLESCRWYHLAYVALLAGFSEELLFRGVLQFALLPWGLVTALVISNLLFALAHAVSRMYFLLAGLMGIYLGVLFHVAGSGNLVVPMLTHALYDLVAFVVVRQTYAFQLAATDLSRSENGPPAIPTEPVKNVSP